MQHVCFETTETTGCQTGRRHPALITRSGHMLTPAEAGVLPDRPDPICRPYILPVSDVSIGKHAYQYTTLPIYNPGLGSI